MLRRVDARAVMLQHLSRATVRGSGADHWAWRAGGPPSWGNATGSAPPPWPAVNATMTPKAPYNSTGQSPPHTCTHPQLASLLCILMGMRWQWVYAWPGFQYHFCTGGSTTHSGFILLFSRISGDCAAQGGVPRQRAMQRSSSC